jgi:uncharacterized membrane protein YjfL (UPF0719 family)
MKHEIAGWIGWWSVTGWAWLAIAGESAPPVVEPRMMPPILSWAGLATSVVYGLVGLILLLIGYYVWEMITPYSVKEELIAHRNPAVGMVVAAFIVGMAIVIAAAII